MTIQIRSISLYPHRGKRRDVKFCLGALNIVTGASKTGKSALLDIVDYCWGGSSSRVSKGVISEYVAWYAVHFDNGGEGILISRKNPSSARRAGAEIYFARGIEELPADAGGFQKNTTVDGLKIQLSATLGISENIHVPQQVATRDPLEASSRHAILFCLQAQYEIADPKLLFHRQGEQFLPQAIRDALPYFLGAVEEDHFRAVKRLHITRRKLRQLKRENVEVESIANDSSNTARNLMDEARRAGLIARDRPPVEHNEVLNLLRGAIIPQQIAFSTPEDLAVDLTILEDRRRDLRRKYQELSDEFAFLDQLRREASKFKSEASEQRARLASVDLISDGDEDTSENCPLCNAQLSVSIPAVSEIKDSLIKVKTQIRSVQRDIPRLQEKLAELEIQREELGEQLRDTNSEIQKCIQDNERLRLEQNQFTEQARVAGRIEFYLEKIQFINEDNQPSLRLGQLQAELTELEAIVNDEATQERLTTILNILSHDLTNFSKRLSLEHSENPIRLDPKRLTVVADSINGPLPLEQMGSAENWVGYHVAAHLSLHRIFRLRDCPVPGILMLDQPSQAHYPPDHDAGENADDLPDEDQVAVRKLFKLLYDYCEEFAPNMQIIVSDHVDLVDDWFQDSIIERWRDGKALVPDSYLND